MSEPDPFAGFVWLTSRQGAAYVPCLRRSDGSPSPKAFGEWCRRHGLVKRRNGSVSKRDIDRVLGRRKPRRVMHPNSLNNLRALSPTTGSPLGTEAAPASEATAVPQRAQQESA